MEVAAILKRRTALTCTQPSQLCVDSGITLTYKNVNLLVETIYMEAFIPR